MSIRKPISFGILGGMGPYATEMFYRKILDISAAKKDWEYPHIIIDSASYIPSRTRYIMYKEKSPVEEMKNVCMKLEKYPVDYIAIPCNSASIFIAELQSTISIPILNIIELTVKNIVGDNCNCVVLGGRVTYLTDSYKEFLNNSFHNYVKHDEYIQILVEELIEDIKVQKMVDIEKKFKNIYNELKRNIEFDCIILGCTELTIFSDLKLENVKVVDSSYSLAKEIVRISNGRI